ncbi:uncharacterized protein [Mycetomoellerius zeteki]|uniref:uncharacterized protein n=1 Tax=Mycetomoellerius zeteki TaxID=64791 RepID=UPI00084E70D9|nr:PREDICTED: uncharacterized protein LOC108724080 [Trachymyrmex zeteki]XP_018305747.1 PREDICTED: uncharacterized protein LOC108724080 [Trachymyrmex zeteki]
MMLKRNARKLFGIGMRYVEPTNGHDVSSWVTVVSSFTTFGGRDPNCFGYDAIFRRIWANSKGTRRVDVINKDFLKRFDLFFRVGPAEAIGAHRDTRDALIRTSKVQAKTIINCNSIDICQIDTAGRYMCARKAPLPLVH